MGKILCILFCILISNLLTIYGQTCNNYTFSKNEIYARCVSLPVLNSHLHWNYHTNGTVDVAFRHTGSTTDQWVAWALNVNGSGMVGSQSIVALVSSNRPVQGYTSPVTSYVTGLQPGPLSFEVTRISIERVNGVVVIYAALVLPNNVTSFNHVWQLGPVVNGAPMIHELNPANRNATGIVDFSTGLTTEVVESHMRLRKTHVVLNMIRGILLIVGVMIARYSRMFMEKDTNVHIVVQIVGFVVGIAAWATRLKLGRESTGIANALIALTVVQVFVAIFKPKEEPRRCWKSLISRYWWNVFHHSIGYSVIVLNIINVYQGLEMFEHEKKWKKLYSGILIFLGAISIISDAATPH